LCVCAFVLYCNTLENELTGEAHAASNHIFPFPWHSSVFYIKNTHCTTQADKLLHSQTGNQLCWVCNICIGLHCTSIDHARVIYSTLLVPRGSCFHSMQLVPIVIPSVANGHAKLNAAGTLGLPILMEAHVLEGVGSTTVLDIIPEQDSITGVKLDHDRSSTVTLLLDDQLPTWLQGDEEGPWVTGGGLLGQLLGNVLLTLGHLVYWPSE